VFGTIEPRCRPEQLTFGRLSRTRVILTLETTHTATLPSFNGLPSVTTGFLYVTMSDALPQKATRGESLTTVAGRERSSAFKKAAASSAARDDARRERKRIKRQDDRQSRIGKVATTAKKMQTDRALEFRQKTEKLSLNISMLYLPLIILTAPGVWIARTHIVPNSGINAWSLTMTTLGPRSVHHFDKPFPIQDGMTDVE